MTDTVVADPARDPATGSASWAGAQPEPQGARPAMVEFRALGPVEALVGGRLVDLGAPKQRALLALLLTRAGQPVAVDVLLEALWAGHPPPSATTSLQAYVANLRRALEPRRAPRTPATVLRTVPRGYLVDSRVVDIDVHRFGERATAGWQAWDRGDAPQALAEFEAALALWRGQAYAEVADVTWVVPDVARLEELRLSVVEARCAALLAVGAHEVAVAELEAFIQAHPLREYGCELLSLALYRAGRQADALGVLRTIQTRLVEELGIDPRPALQQLEREILNQSPALDWQPTATVTGMAVPLGPATAPQPHPTGPPPPPAADGELLVGRDDVLRQLVEALNAAATGRGRVVTVSGEPGIGKTSLLRGFARLAGVPVLWGTCPEHVAAPPLWLWEQVARAVRTCFPQCPVPAPVAELLDGERRQPLTGVDFAGVTLRRFEAIVQYLTDASHTAPLVVILDNLHRADLSSLRLLAHLAESVPASRLLLLGSYRSNESGVLAEALAALACAGVTRIELTGLDAPDTRTLASAVLRQQVSAATAEALCARADGNPFFLRELIKLLSSEQRLDQPHAVPVPVPVREVVLRRVARLPRTAAELLSVAAVAGRCFDLEVVAEAAAVETEAALETLDTAVAAGLVVEDQQRLGWFRFTHALAAEALYENTGRLRRVRLHRRIGAAAARAWAGNTGRAAEIARHWLLAAELDPTAAAQAADHAAAAARIADAGSSPDEAVALWRQALDAADLAGTADPDRYPLLLGLGAALCRAGDTRGGLRAFLQAMRHAFGAPDDAAPAGVDTARLAAAVAAAVTGLTWHPVEDADLGGDLADVLTRALPLTTDPGRRALLLSCLAVAYRRDADPAPRAALSDEALALTRRAADATVSAHVLCLRAAALDGPDHVEQRLQAVTDLLALPGLSPLMTLRARQLRAQALLTTGQLDDATEPDDAALPAQARRSPLWTQAAWSRAGRLLLRGRWREAEQASRAAHAAHARTAWADAPFNRTVQRWEQAFLTGAGTDLVDELRAAVRSGAAPALHSILAMALIDAGDVREARATLRRLPDPPRDGRWLYTRCWALLAATRLGDGEWLSGLRAPLLTYRHLVCSVPGVVTGAPVAYFTGEAALATGDTDTALTELAGAEDTLRRMGSQPWLARVTDAVRRCTGSGAGAPAHTVELSDVEQ